MAQNIDALIISDLHLKPTEPKALALFNRFISERAPHAKKLFILGDFFELWIGDDAMDNFATSIAQTLKKLNEQGVEIFIMRGNRDVLLGQQFCEQAGASLIPDPYILEQVDQRILLCHGDHMCTSDVGYMRYRKVATCALFQKCFLALPRCFRAWVATKIRQSSKNKYQQNPVMVDVSHDAVIETFKQHKANIMIHGHTHILGEHEYPGVGTRYVNRDWHETASFINIKDKIIEVTLFP